MAMKSSFAKKQEAERAILKGEFALMQSVHRAFSVYIFLRNQSIKTFYDGDVAEMRENPNMKSSAILLWQDRLQMNEHRSANEIRAMMMEMHGRESRSLIGEYLDLNFKSQIDWYASDDGGIG